MDYISVKEFAQKYGVSERTARNYCASGKIEGVVLVGKTWNIPADATLPMRKSKKQQVSPLLSILREQKNMKLKGGIYHRTQIDLTYNSNHIEGSRLSRTAHHGCPEGSPLTGPPADRQLRQRPRHRRGTPHRCP